MELYILNFDHYIKTDFKKSSHTGLKLNELIFFFLISIINLG